MYVKIFEQKDLSIKKTKRSLNDLPVFLLKQKRFQKGNAF